MKTTKLNFKYIFKGQVFENLSFKSVHVTGHSKIHGFFFYSQLFSGQKMHLTTKVSKKFNFFDVQ